MRSLPTVQLKMVKVVKKAEEQPQSYYVSQESGDEDDDDDGDDDGKTQFPLDLKMVVGRKGRPMLLMGGHAFFRNNTHKTKTYWLCAKSRSLKCRARIITLDGSAGLILKNQVHNHPPCEKS